MGFVFCYLVWSISSSIWCTNKNDDMVCFVSLIIVCFFFFWLLIILLTDFVWLPIVTVKMFMACTWFGVQECKTCFLSKNVNLKVEWKPCNRKMMMVLVVMIVINLNQKDSINIVALKMTLTVECWFGVFDSLIHSSSLSSPFVGPLQIVSFFFCFFVCLFVC